MLQSVWLLTLGVMKIRNWIKYKFSYCIPMLLCVKILAGLQNFGMPQFVATPQRHYLESVQKGITYAVRCLVDLTATQYATVTAQQKELPSNKGRIILLAPLKK